MSIAHLIADRDGVLNREGEPGTWILQPRQWQWEEGALEALVQITRAGVRLTVVTNQSCIGRGIATREQIDRVHRHMLEQAQAAGAEIHAVIVCPHAPQDSCACRKPNPGMVLEAIEKSGLPVAETLLIGDDLRDLEAGRAAGISVALVKTGKGSRYADALPQQGLVVYDDLLRATAEILST